MVRMSSSQGAEFLNGSIILESPELDGFATFRAPPADVAGEVIVLAGVDFGTECCMFEPDALSRTRKTSVKDSPERARVSSRGR
jgi:hypothetical protein